MKTAVLAALETVEIQERPLPEPGPGEARVKVAAVGVCGSDVHYYAEGRIGSQIAKFPTVMGHEPAGVIDALGPGVKDLPGAAKDLRPGTRVMVEPGHSCGRCAHCLGGRQNICPDVVFLGTPPVEGIFAQYRNMPAACCIPMPENVSMAEAALLEPVGVGFHAVGLMRGRLGDSIAVLGCGPIGLSIALAARAAGVLEIRMADPIPERRAFAEKFVDARTFWEDSPAGKPMDAKNPVVAWLQEANAGLGPDIIYEAAGEQDALTQACLAVRVGGQVSLVGIPSVDEWTMPMHVCRRKELAMRHIRRSNGESVAAMNMVSAGRLSIKEMATHHFPLEKTAEAFDLVRRKRGGVIRAIIHPNEIP